MADEINYLRPRNDPYGYGNPEQTRTDAHNMLSEKPGSGWLLPYLDPRLAEILAQTIHYGSMLPIGSSPRGAAKGRDAVMANRLERRMDRMEGTDNPSWDMGATGGAPKQLSDGTIYFPMNSAARMAMDQPSIRPASEGTIYHPARQDRPVAVNDARFGIIQGGKR